jgi:hypothetical protein
MKRQWARWYREAIISPNRMCSDITKDLRDPRSMRYARKLSRDRFRRSNLERHNYLRGKAERECLSCCTGCFIGLSDLGGAGSWIGRSRRYWLQLGRCRLPGSQLRFSAWANAAVPVCDLPAPDSFNVFQKVRRLVVRSCLIEEERAHTLPILPTAFASSFYSTCMQ